MPIVRIDIQAGKSTAYKRDILHSVREAITGSLGVPGDRVMQRIIETPSENIDSPETRTDHLTIIEVSMLPGRDAALKQAMYAAMVAQLGERPGIHQGDITVIVNDPSAECFAIGGVMQCTLPGAAEPGEDEDEELPTPEPVAQEPEVAEEAPEVEAAPVPDGEPVAEAPAVPEDAPAEPGNEA